MTRPAAPLRAAAGVLLAGLAASCTGQFGDLDPAADRGPDRFPDGGPDRSPDRDLEESDPELFEIALRYFPGQGDEAAAPRLFRLTRGQLQSTTETLFSGRSVPSLLTVMPPDPRQTNYEYAQNLGFNNANFTPYTQWVQRIAQDLGEDPRALVSCNDPADDECLAREAESFVRRAFRGVTRPEQLARFRDFFISSVSEVGLDAAVADLTTLVLTSPSYVFREEVLTDEAGTLLPAQLLQNVTYTLADASPEALGFDTNSAALHVGTPEALGQTLEQVLSSRQARDKLLRFFIAWLEVKEADELDISTVVVPEFTPEVARAAVEETRAFLAHALGGEAPSLRAVTQSTHSFVSDELAPLYGLPTGSDGLLALDPSQRLGIFTQPAMIASHSGPTTTRLVKRGVFFTRKVMCLPLGAPPPGTETTVEETPGFTERQIIEEGTRAPTCAGCHAYINPFGFMQENYDLIGRWRTTDHGLPIDASISVDFLDEGPLVATSPVEALTGFTSSARFKQCFTRQLFRFYMGRDETTSDHPALRRSFVHFARDDRQDVLGLLRSLVFADGFARRKEGT